MAEKLFTNVRLGLKIDTLENWGKSTLVLKKGEVAFATAAATAGNGLTEPVCMMKIGDGDHTFSELKWDFYAKAADVIAAAKSEDTLTAFINNVIASSGIATNEAMGKLAERVTAVEGRATTIEGEIATLKGEGDGSIAKKIADAIAALDLDNTYAAKTHSHTKSEITDFAHNHEMTEINGLSDAIKDAKKAGTDANTALEAYKVTNDARVKAVEDDIAEINDGTNGILAQAKAYADGKDGAIAAAKKAGDDAQADITAYKSSNDTALAGVKATAEAAATKVYTDEELAKKVDKVEGKSLVDDAEITKLAGVSAGANKVEASANNGKIKIDGVETTVYTHPDKHAISEITGLQDALDGKQAAGNYAAEEHTHTKDEITDFAHTHTASEITDFDDAVKAYDYATKAEAKGYADAKDDAIAAAKKAGDDAQGEVDALEAYVGTFTASEGVDTVVKYIDAKTANIASDERVSGIENRVKAIEDDYLVEADKTELAGLITAEKERAEGIEGGLRTDVDAIKADYLKASDKEDIQNQINLIMNNPDTEGVINSIEEFTNYINTHGEIAEGFRTDIDANADAIAAINDAEDGILAQANAYTDGKDTAMGARVKALEDAKDNYVAADEEVLADAKEYADGLNTAMNTRVEALEAIDHDHSNKTVLDGITAEKVSAWDNAQANAEATAAGALATARTEISAEIDADVKVVNDALEAYKTANNAEVAKKANDADLAAIAKTGSTDDLVQGVLEIVFDCGGAGVVAE